MKGELYENETIYESSNIWDDPIMKKKLHETELYAIT